MDWGDSGEIIILSLYKEVGEGDVIIILFIAYVFCCKYILEECIGERLRECKRKWTANAMSHNLNKRKLESV